MKLNRFNKNHIALFLVQSFIRQNKWICIFHQFLWEKSPAYVALIQFGFRFILDCKTGKTKHNTFFFEKLYKVQSINLFISFSFHFSFKFSVDFCWWNSVLCIIWGFQVLGIDPLNVFINEPFYFQNTFSIKQIKLFVFVKLSNEITLYTVLIRHKFNPFQYLLWNP